MTVHNSENLLDGAGSLATRMAKLKEIQRLGLADKKLDVVAIARDPKVFSLMEGKMLTSARDAAHNSGLLFPHTTRDDTGRKITWYEGDARAAWAPFMAPAMVARINKNCGTHEETVRVRDDERVMVVKKNSP